MCSIGVLLITKLYFSKLAIAGIPFEGYTIIDPQLESQLWEIYVIRRSHPAIFACFVNRPLETEKDIFPKQLFLRLPQAESFLPESSHGEELIFVEW